MSLIGKEISEFSVQAFVKGEFKQVTKKDVIGKWAVFFFYPEKFRGRTGGSIINDQVSSVEIFAGRPFYHAFYVFRGEAVEAVIGHHID